MPAFGGSGPLAGTRAYGSTVEQLCDAFDIPKLSLIDTPGNMVGPLAEKTALIRRCARMYVAGANITVPYFNVVLRKARYDTLVAESYAWAKALNAGTVFEVDDVVDPADIRKWLVMGLTRFRRSRAARGRNGPGWIPGDRRPAGARPDTAGELTPRF